MRGNNLRIKKLKKHIKEGILSLVMLFVCWDFMGKPNSTLAYTFIKVIYLDYLFSQVHFHGYKFPLLKVTFF